MLHPAYATFLTCTGPIVIANCIVGPLSRRSAMNTKNSSAVGRAALLACWLAAGAAACAAAGTAAAASPLKSLTVCADPGNMPLSNQKGEGFEYHLLVLAMAAAIMIAGSGAWSVDRALSRKL